MLGNEVDDLKQYLQRRISVLKTRLSELREQIHVNPTTGDFDYDLLREFLEIKGRVAELESLLKRNREWHA